jgi:hypothetical protein
MEKITQEISHCLKGIFQDKAMDLSQFIWLNPDSKPPIKIGLKSYLFIKK